MRLNLQTKFLIGVMTVFSIVIAAGVFWLFHDQQRRVDEAASKNLNQIEALIEATGTYVRDVIRPVVEGKTDEFLPEVESATVVARGIFDRYAKRYPNYSFKEAADNPLNLRSKADSFEEELLRKFRADRGLKRLTLSETDEKGRRWSIASTPMVVEKDCLRCHGSPDNAPAKIVALYGRDHGYGWKVGDVAAALTVRVPTDSLHAELKVITARTLVFFAVLGVALAGMTWFCARRLVCLPVERMGMHMLSIAENGAYHQKLSEAERNDEVGESAKAFNHVLTVVERSLADLREANESLEARVAERTTEIARSNAQLAAIHATSMDCVMVMDQQGCITEFNPAAERTFKCKREDVIGRNMIGMCIAPIEHRRLKENLRDLIEHPNCPTGGVQSEVGAVRSDGEEFCAELVVHVI